MTIPLFKNNINMLKTGDHFYLNCCVTGGFGGLAFSHFLTHWNFDCFLSICLHINSIYLISLSSRPFLRTSRARGPNPSNYMLMASEGAAYMRHSHKIHSMSLYQQNRTFLNKYNRSVTDRIWIICVHSQSKTLPLTPAKVIIMIIILSQLAGFCWWTQN